MKKYDELLKSGETKNLLILLKMIHQQQKQKNYLSVADNEIVGIAMHVEQV